MNVDTHCLNDLVPAVRCCCASCTVCVSLCPRRAAYDARHELALWIGSGSNRLMTSPNGSSTDRASQTAHAFRTSDLGSMLSYSDVRPYNRRVSLCSWTGHANTYRSRRRSFQRRLQMSVRVAKGLLPGLTIFEACHKNYICTARAVEERHRCVGGSDA